MEGFTHLDSKGKAKMVDISDKETTLRIALASGCVYMKPETFRMIVSNEIAKGDVLGVAKVAGIMAAKRTGEIIPLCHPINITNVNITFTPVEDDSRIEITAEVKTLGRTGVEMEALTAVTVSALTIYDMCKAVDKGMEISGVKLLKKSGGRSGTYVRNED